MALRPDVSLGLQPSVFRPAAAPVDNTVRVGPSPLRDLAGSLAEGSQVLRQFAGDVGDRQKAKDTAKAQADVAQWLAAGKSSADAIREGLISPGASPVYRYAAREAYGRLEAVRFGTTLMGQVDDAVQSSNGAISFEDLVQQHLPDSAKGATDEAYRQGFFRNLDAQLYNARQRFAVRQAEVSEASSVDTMQAEMYETAQNVMAAAPDGHFDPQDLVSRLETTATRYLAVNPRGGTAVNKALTTAIAALATDHEDESILSLGDQVRLPNGTLLSSTQLYREAADKARGDIYRRGAQLDAARDRQINQQVDDAYGRLIEQQAQGKPIDWDAERMNLRQSSTAFNALRSRFEAATDTSDDPHLLDLYTRGIVANDGSVTNRVLADAVGNGLTSRTAFSLLTQLRTNQRFFDEMPQRFKQVLTDGAALARRVASEQTSGILTLRTGKDTKRSNELELRFRQDFLHYYSTARTDPKADPVAWELQTIKAYREEQNGGSSHTPPPGPPPLSSKQVNDLINELTVTLHDGDLSPQMHNRLLRLHIPEESMRDPDQVRALLTAKPSSNP